MATTALNKETSDKISFIAYIIPAFAKFADASTELHLKSWQEIYELLKQELQ